MAKTREPVYLTSRRAALREGEPKYKTGEECKQGHIAFRYTASGACSECISSAGIKARYGTQERKDEAALLREARAEAVRDLVEVKLRCYMSHLDQLRGIVVAVTQGRYPMLDRAQIISSKPPGANEGGTQLHRFNVSSQDVDQLRATANALLNTKGVNVEARRAAMLKARLEETEEEAEDNGEPDFDPNRA